MFKHFLITRFNLNLGSISAFDKNNKPVQTEEWLEQRFFLFEKYCLPSIMNQTCKDFIWFVFFNCATPDRFINKINDYGQQFPLFKPLFLETGDYDSIKKEFNEAVTLFLDADTQYIITTRIDNDDAFHKDIISEVQNYFSRQSNVFLSFTYGLQYDINQQILSRMNSKNNHFISRIEEINNGIETVITHDHYYIDTVTTVIYVSNKNKPMWLEVVHEGNIKNSLDVGNVPLFRNRIVEFFNFNGEISSVNTFLMLLKYLRLKVLILRLNILQKIGIYDIMKKLFNNR